ncbi:unnamed protein product [Polarella glacialis]|uniref:EF-hand domain-containing protein n=1 Tax=Polarella glacialis TaxID=89957 RepID=A0A813FF26_POLGL|nr:unnamed protein product [Polarella glacialis]CAE8620952.1 unnamed protein product [Polarella glacialis]CAE8713167.1 unnamed protein product [Polarella glacialis]
MNAEWRRNISNGAASNASNSSASYSEPDKELSNRHGSCQAASKPSNAQGLASMKGSSKSASLNNVCQVSSLALSHPVQGKVEIARRMMARCFRHQAFDLSLGLIICLDVIFNVADIDARAVGQSPPMWADIGAKTCLAAYTVELLLHIFVSGWAIFRNPWSFVDFCIIFSGWLEVILTAGGISAKEFTLLRLLRLQRILRLMKLCRHNRWLTELKTLVMMMASCVRTLFWSFLFCFIVMSAWSMAAVELINPVVQQMAADGAFGDCRSCRSSLTSVMRANLFMFQTIVAGDSWGELAVPVIEAHPWTAIIFIGSLLTLVFGVLNLIVAVVIDTYAEHRQKDVINLAQELDAEAADDRRFLQKIFDQIDEDDSGELNLDEVLLAAKTNPEFKSRLRVMDIDEGDLVQMFEMLDGDGSGQVDPEEFINALNRWANHSKTAARFAKYQMMRSIVQHAELHQEVVSKLDNLEKRLDIEPSFNLREEKLITVVVDESPLAEEFQVGGSGELAEVKGSEWRGPDIFLARQRQTGFYFPHESGVGKWPKSFSFGKGSILEPEPEQSLKTAIAAAISVLRESLMAAPAAAMTDPFLADELILRQAMPKSSGSSGSFEKMGLRQSVTALAIGCKAVGAAPLNRAAPPLLGPRGPQSTFAVCVNSDSSTPPAPPSACRVTSNSNSKNNKNNNAAGDDNNNSNIREQLCVQVDPPLDGPEQHPAWDEFCI